MFGIWTFLYGIAVAVRKKARPNLWLVLILGTAYGLLIELLQFAVPTNRSPELMDFIADMSGSAAAIILLYWIFKRIFKQDPQMA